MSSKCICSSVKNPWTTTWTTWTIAWTIPFEMCPRTESPSIGHEKIAMESNFVAGQGFHDEGRRSQDIARAKSATTMSRRWVGETSQSKQQWCE